MRTASCAKPLVRHFEALYLRRLVDAHAHTHPSVHTRTSSRKNITHTTQRATDANDMFMWHTFERQIKSSTNFEGIILRRTIKTDSPKAASSASRTKDILGCAFCGHKATRKAIKNGTKRSSNATAAWWHSPMTKGTVHHKPLRAMGRTRSRTQIMQIIMEIKFAARRHKQFNKTQIDGNLHASQHTRLTDTWHC